MHNARSGIKALMLYCITIHDTIMFMFTGDLVLAMRVLLGEKAASVSVVLVNNLAMSCLCIVYYHRTKV